MDECLICYEEFDEFKICENDHKVCFDCYGKIKDRYYSEENDVKCTICTCVMEKFLKIFISFYDNGLKKMEFMFDKNYKKQGLHKWYYENGNLKKECFYKDDKRDGLYKQYYENGDIKEECFYKDDKSYGLYKEYYENGDIKEECFFKDGKRDGMDIIWSYRGDLMCLKIYKNDILKADCYFFYENGQTKYMNYYKKQIEKIKKNGIKKVKKKTIIVEYNQDGIIKSKSKKIEIIYKKIYIECE